MHIYVTGLALFLCAIPWLVRSQYGCDRSREDVYPCYYKPNRLRAGPNEYSVHYTRMVKINETITCKAKKWKQYVAPISNLGTDSMKVLYSPGFEFDEPYLPNLRVEYKVHCYETQLAFYNITLLDLPNADCSMENINRCQDYINISRPSFGNIEHCGSTPSESALLQLENPEFTVVFRTSHSNTNGRKGFQMYVTCFNPAEEIDDCCASGSSSRRKKCASCHDDHLPAMYADFFPNGGYPSNLPMASDLAQFHGRWRIFLHFGVVRISIGYNQIVYYNQSAIVVMNYTDGSIIHRYPNISRLETFSSDGVIERHCTDWHTNLHGRGQLIIIPYYMAFLQLFWIDPREYLPNEAEQRELVLMTTPLLKCASKYSTNFMFFNDTDFAFPSSPHDSYPHQRSKRMPIPDEFDQSDEDAVSAALRNENACNPVLRAQSRATLQFYPQYYIDRFSSISCPTGGT